MKLPHNKDAYIPDEKLTDYLLSETHAIGKLKAKFFRALGFNEENVSVLKQSLLNIAHSEKVTDIIETPHGKKYIIDGPLDTPDEKEVIIRTVWIIEINENKPRFITAYPI